MSVKTAVEKTLGRVMCPQKAAAGGKTAAVPAGIPKMIPPVQMTIQEKKTETVLTIIPEPERKIIRKAETEPETKTTRERGTEPETKMTRERGTEPETKMTRQRGTEPGMEMIRETGIMITQMQTEMALVMVQAKETAVIRMEIPERMRKIREMMQKAGMTTNRKEKTAFISGLQMQSHRNLYAVSAAKKRLWKMERVMCRRRKSVSMSG